MVEVFLLKLIRVERGNEELSVLFSWPRGNRFAWDLKKPEKSIMPRHRETDFLPVEIKSELKFDLVAVSEV